MICLSKRDKIKISSIEEPLSYKDDQGWYSPEGKFYPLDGIISHGQWVVAYYDWLTSVKHISLPPKEQIQEIINKKGSDYIRNILVKHGWVWVFSYYIFAINSFEVDSQKLIEFLLTSGHFYKDNDEIRIYSLQKDNNVEIDYSELIEKGI